MISITERKTGQQFESKKLASEYFRIPITVVNKSIDQGKEVEYKNNKYFFTKSRYDEGRTIVFKISKTLPFGKYKGKEPKDVPHNYLNWLSKQSFCPKCVTYYLKGKNIP